MKAVADGVHEPYSHMVAKNIAAVHHQHFFSFRLDMDVDGQPNRVVEMNSAPEPAGPKNPYGGAFTMQETVLATEKQAQRRINLAISRRWIVESSAQKNALGQPTGYALLPGENAVPFAQPDSWIRKRGRILERARLGDALQRDGALPGGRLSEPEQRRRRADAVDRGRPAGR